MKITKLKASFGRLAGETLELKDGLNVVHMENESGKSTWSAFIPAMLYGVDTSERSAGGRLPDKQRYKPWDGRAMEGSMELEAEGRRLRLERTSKGGPMKQFGCVNLDTGAPAGLEGETAGQELTGVSREVFRRSALIKQGTIKIDNSADLERRLLATATGGDEGASYGEVRARLEQWQKAIKNRQGGELAKLEAARRELDARLEDISALAARGGELRAELESLAAARESAKKEVDAHRAREGLDKSREIAKARMEVLRLEGEIKKLTGGRVPPTRAALGELERRLDALERLRQTQAAARVSAENARADREAFQSAETVFSGLTAQQAEAKLAEKRAARAGSGGVVVFIVLAAVFAALAVVCGAVVRPGWYAVIPAVLAAVWVILAAAASKRKKSRAQTLAGELSGLEEQYAVFLEDISARAHMDEAVSAAGEAFAAASEELRLRDAEAVELAGEVLGGSGTSDEIRPALDAAYALLDSLSELAVRREAAARYRDDISKDQPHADGKYDLDSLPVPVTEKQEALGRLEQAQELYSRCENELSRLAGRISAVGDYDDIFARREHTGEKIQRALEEYAALDAAIRALDAANDNLSMRFSPGLNERAGEYFRALTGGRYESLLINREMEVRAREAGSVVDREAGYLSAGAGDQLYLAVRLAICDLVLPQGENAPPIILDDALSSFDDRRMGYALELLEKLAEKRQIILFTCQEREAEYLKNR